MFKFIFQNYEVLWKWQGVENDEEEPGNSKGTKLGQIIYEETFVRLFNFVENNDM